MGVDLNFSFAAIEIEIIESAKILDKRGTQRVGRKIALFSGGEEQKNAKLNCCD